MDLFIFSTVLLSDTGFYTVFLGASSWSGKGAVELEGGLCSDEAGHLRLQELGRAVQSHAR